VKLREQILENNVYTENQKLRLLRYFSKTVQAHSSMIYSNIFSPFSKQDFGEEEKDLNNKLLQQLLQPRIEFFGGNFLSYLSLNGDLVERVLNRLRGFMDYITGENPAQQMALDEEHGSDMGNNFLKVNDLSLVHDFTPVMSKDSRLFNKFQLDGFLVQNRFCEMDMNMISPITRGINELCYNTVKLYINYIKDMAREVNDKEFIRDHAPIFYGAVK